jgi:hypothetical protein
MVVVVVWAGFYGRRWEREMGRAGIAFGKDCWGRFFDPESGHQNEGLHFQALSWMRRNDSVGRKVMAFSLRQSWRKIEQRFKKPVVTWVLFYQKKPQRTGNSCRNAEVVGRGSAARRAIPRARNRVQSEGHGWLILNVTITCLSKGVEGWLLTRQKPSAKFFPFFGCRVWKDNRLFGETFA